MSEEPEDHGLIDDDPALDCILYNEMVKDDQRPQGKGKGGCLSLVLFILAPLISFILLLLFFILSTPNLSIATDNPDHYCADQVSCGDP